MRMGIDLDGVVVDFAQGWSDRWEAEGGGYPDAYRGGQQYDDMWKMTGHPNSEAWWEWFRRSGGFDNLPLYPSALPALVRMEARGDELICLTSRPRWARDSTYRLPFIGLFAAVMFTSRKYEIPCNAYVEDNPRTLAQLVIMGRRTFRMMRPWNEPTPGAFPIGSLLEFAELDWEGNGGTAPLFAQD